MFETETKENRAWAAGVYEGEGTITLSSKTYRYKGELCNRKSRPMQLRIGMTDLDIIERLQDIMGGYIFYGTPYKSHHKPNYVLCITRAGEIMTNIGMMWPYLGERRREQAKKVILSWKG